MTDTEIQSYTEQELKASVLNYARGYYQTLWSACSQDEQFLLVHLAQSRFVNTKNPALRTLLARRLVRRAPSLRLMNESFAQFVMTTYRPEALQMWEQDQLGSTSQILRGTLFTTLLGGGLFLYLTQHELVKATEAFAATITTGALPTLFRLMGGVFRKDSGKEQK